MRLGYTVDLSTMLDEEVFLRCAIAEDMLKKEVAEQERSNKTLGKGNVSRFG